MARGKKKKMKFSTLESPTDEEVKKIPINNLPENYIWMRVKSGTKIRNVLEYAFKHFPKRKAIVWSAIGQGVGKCITCAELFKRKNPGLHQVTRLRYVPSNKSTTQSEASSEARNVRVPEIYIFLSNEPTHVTEPGYQDPNDTGMFLEATSSNGTDKATDSSILREIPSCSNTTGRITSLAAEEFAAMGLRTGQKRLRKEQQQTETPSKKNKKKDTPNEGADD